MKIKALLLAALVSAAAVSANAGVRFGVSIGLPLPVVVVPRVVVVAPPVVFAPAPVVVAATPPCPGVGYVWTAGYWSYRGPDRVWVGGGWNYRPAHGDMHVDHGRYDGGHRR